MGLKMPVWGRRGKRPKASGEEESRRPAERETERTEERSRRAEKRSRRASKRESRAAKKPERTGKTPARPRRRPALKRPASLKASATGLGKRAGKAGKPLAAGLAEVLAIGREMLAIPAAMALGLAERLGLLVLAAWRFLRPLLTAAAALARRGVDVAARALTPARAVAVVALAAAVLLAASQFLDYREVRAGVPAYAEVEQVVPPPQVSGTTRSAGSAHAYLLLLVALVAAALVVLSMMGRWRMARLLFPLGAVAVAVAVFIDAPAGLDEGVTAIQFQGTEARLLDAFWVQLSAAAVIALCGPLLALALRSQRAASGRTSDARRSRRRPALGGSRVEGARP